MTVACTKRGQRTIGVGKLGQKDKARAAAKKSDASPPEQRNDLLAHFWHRNLADIFLATGQAKLAIPHYEQAVQKTTIQGYVEGCQKSLAEARAKAGGQEHRFPVISTDRR